MTATCSSVQRRTTQVKTRRAMQEFRCLLIVETRVLRHSVTHPPPSLNHGTRHVIFFHYYSLFLDKKIIFEDFKNKKGEFASAEKRGRKGCIYVLSFSHSVSNH